MIIYKMKFSFFNNTYCKDIKKDKKNYQFLNNYFLNNRYKNIIIHNILSLFIKIKIIIFIK